MMQIKDKMVRLFVLFISAMFLISIFGISQVFAVENVVSEINVNKEIQISPEPKDENAKSEIGERISERAKRIKEKRELLKTVFKDLTPEQRRALLLMNKDEISKMIREGKKEEIKKRIEEKIRGRMMLEKRKWKKRIVDVREKERRINKIKARLKKVQIRIKKHHEMEMKLRILRNKYKQCLASNNTLENESCDEIINEFIEKSKAYLMNGINVSIENLEALKDKVESSEYLNETQIQNIVIKIDNEIEILKSIEDEIAACNEISCLRDAAERLKRNIIRIKFLLKLRIFEEEMERIGLINERANAILARLELLMERAEKMNLSQDKIELLEENVNEIREDIDLACAKKDEAQENFEKAKEAFREGDIEAGKAYLEMSKDALEEARRALRDANSKLQRIWNYIKLRKKLRIFLVEKTEALEAQTQIEIE